MLDDEDTKIVNKDDLIEMRRIRLLDLKLWSILNEVGIFAIFLLLVYVVSFFNLNNSSYTYNQLFLSTFVQKQSPKEFGLDNVNFLYLTLKIRSKFWAYVQIIPTQTYQNNTY